MADEKIKSEQKKRKRAKRAEMAPYSRTYLGSNLKFSSSRNRIKANQLLSRSRGES